MIFTFKLLIATLLGGGLSFIQAPYNYAALIIPCFSIFYYLYNSADNKKQAFFLSFFFTMAYFIAGLNWIGNALLVDGNEYKWAWPLSVIALPTLLALFAALYLTINHIIFKQKTIAHFLGFCLFLSLSEFVRGYAFTGFPWNLYGYGTASIPEISQALSVIGPYGLTLLTILWGAVLGLAVQPQKYRTIVCFLVVSSFPLTFFLGQQRLAQANVEYNKDVQLHLVQPNIEQAMKWKNDKLAENFEKHISALDPNFDTNKKHIVIWPETAIPPVLLSSLAAKQRIQNMLGDNILLSGGLVANLNKLTMATDYHNALLKLEKTGDFEKLYSKSHLVPFGEYIPFQQYIPLVPVTQFTGFQRGNGPQTIKTEGYPTFTPLICYEVIFPHLAIKSYKERPDYLLTITNDAWYGDSAGPRQHFEQARYRAIENGLPLLRVANTGISGVIDPYGSVVIKKDLFEYGEIKADLPISLKTPTFYSRYKDVPIFLILIFSIMFCRFLSFNKID